MIDRARLRNIDPQNELQKRRGAETEADRAEEALMEMLVSGCAPALIGEEEAAARNADEDEEEDSDQQHGRGEDELRLVQPTNGFRLAAAALEATPPAAPAHTEHRRKHRDLTPHRSPVT